MTTTESGSFMNQLRTNLTNQMNRQHDAASLRADPLVASLMADYDVSQKKREAQRLEDLKRMGVLRDGDRRTLESDMSEVRGRGEMRILADAAQRAQDERQTATTQGLDLSGLMSQREQALADLRGWFDDGTMTIGGQQADLDRIAASIAAAEVGGGKYDPLAYSLLSGLMGDNTGIMAAMRDILNLDEKADQAAVWATRTDGRRRRPVRARERLPDDG